jgi:RNA polymerase sigma-32 factor
MARLTAAQEALLCSPWPPSVASRQALAAANVYLVRQVAHQLRGYAVPYDDLVSEGCIGLMYAIDRFDSARGLRLATYARYWVAAWMLRVIARTDSPIGPGPAARTKIYFRLRRALGASSDLSDVAAAMGETVERVSSWVAELSQRYTMWQDDSGVDSAGVYHELDPDLAVRHAQGTSDPEATAIAREDVDERHAAVAKALASLTDRERRIIETRYLTDEKAPTFRAVARDHGVCHERIRQLEMRALRKMREALGGVTCE